MSVFNSLFYPLRPSCLTSLEIAKDGLPNFGNTCWFNSLIQTVFRADGPFKEALKFRAEHSEDPSTYPDQFSNRAIQLLAILEQDNRLLRNKADFKEFIADFKNNCFKDSPFEKQEDVTEALSALMDYLNLDPLLHRVVPKTNVDITEINYHNTNQEPVSYNIVLPNLKSNSIQEAINQYFAPEYIPNTNGNGLIIDNQSYPCTKTPYLSSDKVDFKELVITLPRFVQDTYGRRKKNKDSIEVDDTITLNLCRDDLTVEKTVTMRLKSVSMHSGELGGGHYTAYVRNSDGSFDYYNDSTKSKHSYEQAKTAMSKNGYFAVYEVIKIEDVFFDALDIPFKEPEEEFFDAVENQANDEVSIQHSFADASKPSPSVSSVNNSLVVSPTSSPTITKTTGLFSRFKSIFTFNKNSQPSKPRIWSRWLKSKSTSQAIVIKTQTLWSSFHAWLLDLWRSKSE